MAEKKKKKHLHKVETIAGGDGTYVHHHHYKDNPEDQHVSHVREHAATSSNSEEAGEHVAEQFGMNQGGSGGEEPGAEAEPDAEQGNAAPME